MKHVAAIFMSLFFAGPALAEPAPENPIRQVMQVQEAYDAIPHRRATFDPAQATMPADEAQYLGQFFSLVDLAIVERVETIGWFTQAKGADNQNFGEILRRMEALKVPAKLKAAHDLVAGAVSEQKAYFDAWRKNPAGSRFSASDPRIQSISNKLRRAYMIYMGTYPNESAHNRDAFYQHLCALDNI